MASIPPYFVNSPLPTGVTPNLLFSDVWQGTLTLPVITLSNSLITLAQSPYTFQTRITDPTLRFQKTAYAAGTTGVYTLALSAVTPVVGKTYKITLYGGANNNPYQYSFVVIATTTSATDLATAINTSITNSQQSQFFTSTVLGTTVTINEVSATTGGFTIVFQGDANAVVATSVANIQPFGTLAMVQNYKPSITSGTFNLYQWSYDVHYPNFDGSGTDTLQREFIQIWIDLAATGYSTADTEMQQFGPSGTFWSSSYSQLQMQQMLNIPN